MSYPKAYFAATSHAELLGTCFVLMPFSVDMQSVYETIRGAVEDPSVGFTVRRADELFGGDQIMTGVLREIARAHVVIADLTGRNPNVFYELGIAHMQKDPERVLLLSQRIEDVPFDLRAYRCLLYSPDEAGLRDLRGRVSRSIREIAGPSYQFAVSQLQAYRTPPEFPAPDRCLYSVEVSDSIMGRGFVKCRLRIWRHVIGEEPRTVVDDGFGLGVGESRQLPRLPWAIRLNSVEEGTASFSIVPADPTAA